jgi:glycosyltransferase involved in cell wall biosynthesis
MRICLVTTFPPSTGGLSEYGFHIAQELKRNPSLSLTILADKLPSPCVEPEGFDVQRCWSFNDPRNAWNILQALQRLKPDVVWFNLLFSTFGRSPFVAFSGLMTPVLARLGGRYSHVTLHHLMDTVDLKDAGVRHEWLYRFAGAVATRLLLLANSVSVLMPGYRQILSDRYGGDNVHLRSHGILARRPEFPMFSRRGSPLHRILAFGKWGTYKRLELMIEAFQIVSAQMPEARLVIAGGDHPQAAGYTESVKRQCGGNPLIEFRGYVAERDIPDLFQSATVAVMPYSSSTGCSGVAHLACTYGVPVVCSDLSDFREMAEGEDLAVRFFPAGDAQGLADCLLELLRDRQLQITMATQNFAAGLCMTMPNVVQKYLRQFELQKRARVLRYVSRIRRLPAWVRSRALLLRVLSRNSSLWSRDSIVVGNVAGNWDAHTPELRNSNGNGRGSLNGLGRAADRDVVLRTLGTATAGDRGTVTAGSADHDEGGQHSDGEHPLQRVIAGLPTATAADHGASNHGAAEHAYPEDPNSEQRVAVSSAFVSGVNGSGSNGQNGAHGPISRSNGSRTEGAGQSVGQARTAQRDQIVE